MSIDKLAAATAQSPPLKDLMKRKMQRARLEAWQNAVEPMVAACRSRRGLAADVVRELETQTGCWWARQEVHCWLHPEPRRRVQPTVGAWLLLRRAYEAVEARHKVADIKA
jgi:hypothetical protein